MTYYSGSEPYIRASKVDTKARSSVNVTSRKKRLFDLAIAVPAFVILGPFLIVIAVLLRLQDGGQAIFKQQRVGVNGEVFEFLKFRSMVIDAPQKFEAHLKANPDAAREWDQFQKLKYDPRITALGRFIRKTSIDELPQLWNILKGDMSIVGPRPMMVSQIEMHGVHFEAYKSVKPGVTGLWQISGRNQTSYAQRAEFDAQYAEKWSIRLDLWIFAKTIPAVVFSRGAY